MMVTGDKFFVKSAGLQECFRGICRICMEDTAGSCMCVSMSGNISSV